MLCGGGYHAVNQIIGKLCLSSKDKIRSKLRIADSSKLRQIFDVITTFCLVAYGWMLFYAPNMQFIVDVTKGYFNFGMPYIHQTTIFFFAIGLAILFLKDCKDEYFSAKVLDFEERYPKIAFVYNYFKYSVLAILIVWIGVLGGGQFIYFKF